MKNSDSKAALVIGEESPAHELRPPKTRASNRAPGTSVRGITEEPPETPHGPLILLDSAIFDTVLNDVLAHSALSVKFFAPQSGHLLPYQVPASLNYSKAARHLWDLPLEPTIIDANSALADDLVTYLHPGSIIRVRGRLPATQSIGSASLILRTPAGQKIRANFTHGALAGYGPEELIRHTLYLVGRVVRVSTMATRTAALFLG